jgi:hypothetical protein
MWRQSWLVVVGTFSAAFMPSCSEGGQTGQPSASNCGQMEVPADSPYHHGTTPRILGQGFEGQYRSGLVWLGEHPLFSSLSVIDDYEDSIAISIIYDGEQAHRGCRLTIPVTVSIETTASGISETGPGTLSIISAKLPYRAWLDYSGSTFALSAELKGHAANVTPVGRLQPHQWATPVSEGTAGDTSTALEQFPGSSAAFPSPEAAEHLFSRARPEAW